MSWVGAAAGRKLRVREALLTRRTASVAAREQVASARCYYRVVVVVVEVVVVDSHSQSSQSHSGTVVVVVDVEVVEVEVEVVEVEVEVVEVVDVEVEEVEVELEVVVDRVVEVDVVGVTVVVVVAAPQLGQQFVLPSLTVPPPLVHCAADFFTSQLGTYGVQVCVGDVSMQVTYPAAWPQVEAAMQQRMAELHCCWPLATITLCMHWTYCAWFENELHGHWLSNWGCNEHRTASQSTGGAVVVVVDSAVVVVGLGLAADALGNNTSAVRNVINSRKASLGVNRFRRVAAI